MIRAVNFIARKDADLFSFHIKPEVGCASTRSFFRRMVCSTACITTERSVPCCIRAEKEPVVSALLTANREGSFPASWQRRRDIAW